MSDYETELKWFKSLNRVLNKMPETVEVSVCNGGRVELHEAGATEKHWDDFNNIENIPTIDVFPSKVEPRSETL